MASILLPTTIWIQPYAYYCSLTCQFRTKTCLSHFTVTIRLPFSNRSLQDNHMATHGWFNATIFPLPVVSWVIFFFFASQYRATTTQSSAVNFFFDGKSVMSMFCNVIMLLLLYVYVCVTRTGWKTRPKPKTVILSIKKSNQIKSNSSKVTE